MATEPQPNISTAQTGAMVTPTYVHRDVTVYAIHDHEAETLSTLNAEATFYFSVASACLSFAMSILLSGIFTDEKLNPAATVLLHFGAPLLGFFAAIFYGLAIYLSNKRSGLWKTIKSQSRSAS